MAPAAVKLDTLFLGGTGNWYAFLDTKVFLSGWKAEWNLARRTADRSNITARVPEEE